MNARDMIHVVFPRARKPVTFASLVPLPAFLILYGAAWAYLELGGLVLFTSRAAFLLLLVTPWVWWMHQAGRSGLRGVRGAAALLIRLSVIGLLAMALAEPRAVRKSDVVSVIYVLDRSDSIGATAQDRALQFVLRTADGRTGKDQAGLVTFGRNAAVETPPSAGFSFDGFGTSVPTDGTNLQKALSLAAAVSPDELLNRVVLITDGVETEGSVSPVLEELKARDIVADVLPVEYAYEHEVWLEKLELPRFVREGETYEAAVVLSSLQAGAGALRLTENGQAIYEGEVDFTEGKNRYVLPLYLRGPGYYEYVATIEVPRDRDGWRENNTVINHLFLKGEGRLLVVTDPAGDARDSETLVGALGESKFLVDEKAAYDLTRDPLSLMPYDCILLVNVPADALDVVQMEALHAAVYNEGIGLLMVGGKNSFGPGGYHRTAVERALPVTMDTTHRKVLPKGALAIILHTCEFPDGNTWGKRVAKEAIRVLGARDEVGALAFDYNGGEKWLFPLTPAAEYERLFTLINQAQIGDMPSFSTTMQMGYDGLMASDAATKHMIIISDGDPAPPPPDLVSAFVQAQISISTVAIFPHGGQDVSLMQNVAAATGGRYYCPTDPSLLPSIFIKEAKTLKRSMIQNVTFVPEVVAPSAVLKGITGLPALDAYVLTTPKERSLTVLKGPETEQVDPVLATWRYGLGKSAAFTSDLSPNWAAQWVQWEHYRAFVRQLITDIARTEQDSHLQMRTFAQGSTGYVEIVDVGPEERFLEIGAEVDGPHDRAQTIRLKQTGPRRYEASFELWGKGQYQVVALGAAQGATEQAFSGFVVAYSPEYLRFRSNPAVLEQIARKTGGRLLTGEEAGKDIFLRDRPPRASSRPIVDWFLVALAILIPLDVGVRRVQLDWALIWGWFRRKGARQSGGETFDALLKRKAAIQFVPEDKEDARAPRPPVAPRAGPTRRERPPEAAAPPAAPEDETPLSTTERLLKMKQKWKEKKDGE